MKILAISDDVVEWIYSPSLASRCADVDLVISCGDLPIHYLEFVTSTLNVPSYYVRGNHDIYEIGEHGMLKTEPEGWINLDARRVRFRGITLAGLEGCLRYKPAVPLQYSQTEQQWRAGWLALRMIRPLLRGQRGVDILVTHAPPFGIHDASDLAHTGFRAHEWLIRTTRPRWLLHGHQHRNYAPMQVGQTEIDKTIVYNVHPYRILDF